MLTPAVDAFGWPTVVVVLVLLVLSLVAVVLDFRRWCRARDCEAAQRRHPAGRAIPSPGAGLHVRHRLL